MQFTPPRPLRFPRYFCVFGAEIQPLKEADVTNAKVKGCSCIIHNSSPPSFVIASRLERDNKQSVILQFSSRQLFPFSLSSCTFFLLSSCSYRSKRPVSSVYRTFFISVFIYAFESFPPSENSLSRLQLAPFLLFFAIPSHYLFVSFILHCLPHALPVWLYSSPSPVWALYTFQLIISQAAHTASASFVAPGPTGRPHLPQRDLHKQLKQSDNTDLKWPRGAQRLVED